MRFSRAIYIATFSFLGVSAAPGKSGSGYGNSPSQSSSANSGQTNNPPPSSGNSGSSGGATGSSPTVENNCPNNQQQVCCNSSASGTTNGSNGGGLLGGLLDLDLTDLLDAHGALACGLSSLLGAGACNHEQICCVAINSPGQTCTTNSGTQIPIDIPINVSL